MTSSIENMISDGLINPTMDLATDYAELAFDAFLDNDAIKELPIVKTIVGVVKGSIKIREIFLAKKLLVFLKQFHSQKISKEKLDKFKMQFNDDQKFRNSVIEQIIILNDRFIEAKKSEYYANLFNAYISELISWTDFKTLSAILDNLHLEALTALIELSNSSPRRFAKTGPALTMPMSLLLSTGLAIWSPTDNMIMTNLYGVCMHCYGIEANFEVTLDKLNEITPLEQRNGAISKVKRRNSANNT